MKRLFILIIAIMLSGCGDSQPLVGSSLNESTNETLTEESISDDRSDSSIPEDSKDHVLPDWSNWLNGGFSYPGMAVNLFEATDLNVPVTDKTHISGGEVKIHLGYNIESGIEFNDNAIMTAFVFVNGEPCNFTLDGAESDKGILVKEAAVNKDIVEELNVSDCSIADGENEIAVMLAAYFPQTGHSQAIQISRRFISDTEATLSDKLTAAERYPEQIKYTDSSDSSTLVGSNNYVFAQLRFESERRCSYVKAGTEIGFHFVNSNEAQDNGVKRDLLFTVLENGRPIKLWNGLEYAAVSAEQEDYALDIPVTVLEAAEKYTHLTVCIFDLNDEGRAISYEHLFYTED